MGCIEFVQALLLSLGIHVCGEEAALDDFLSAHNLIPGIAFHAEVESAVSVTNKLLRSVGQFGVRASWQTIESADAEGFNRVIPIFLADYRTDVMSQSERLKAQETVGVRVNQQLKTTLETDANEQEICEPLEHCTHRPTRSNPSISAISNMLQTISSMETAAAELACECIILIESDLVLFDQIFSHNNSNERGVDLYDYLVFLILHEIGHLHTGFIRPATTGSTQADMLLKVIYNQLNFPQKNELNADIFAGLQLAKACAGDTDDLRGYEKSNPCVAQLAHGIDVMAHMMADTSHIGICSRYLDPSKNYPNYALRTLVTSLYAYPTIFGQSELISSQIHGRQGAISVHPWITKISDEECRTLSTGERFYLGRDCVRCSIGFAD